MMHRSPFMLCGVAGTAAVLSLVLVGCASAPGADPGYADGLRYGAECADARERARAAVTPADLIAPNPVKYELPPLPVPTSVKGALVRMTMRVDSAGYPVPGGIRITGIDDRNYIARMTTVMKRNRFRPAVLDGCAVEGTVTFTYTFG